MSVENLWKFLKHTIAYLVEVLWLKWNYFELTEVEVGRGPLQIWISLYICVYVYIRNEKYENGTGVPVSFGNDKHVSISIELPYEVVNQIAI